MSSIVIYSAKLTQYKPIAWKGQAVYKQYAKLKNHLKKSLGDEYANFFAEPHISESDWEGITNATWRSEIIGNKPTPLNQLPADQRAAATALLQQKMDTLREHSQRMLESESSENNAWGQLINKALAIPDENHILVDGPNIVLVSWGLEYTRAEGGSFDLGKKFPKPPARPPGHPTDTTQSNTPPQSPDPEQTPPADESTPEPKPDSPDLETQTEPKHDLPPDESTEHETASLKDEPAPDSDPDSTLDADKKAPLENPPPDPPKKDPPLEERKDPPGPPDPPIVIPTPIPWWKKYWWLWLLLLLLLMGLFWKTCHRPHPIILPKQPGRVIPIDTSKIVSDPDSVKSIVSDRLNIALTGDNKDPEAWARQFKTLYPGKNYEIIYYDTLTSRLQIQIPASEREKIKTELPAKMPGFEMLIWYEGIFQHNNIPGDPGFSNVRDYWWLQEVKAFGAWDLTKGDPNLVVAIIDDGFDIHHREFEGKVYKPWNVPAYSPDVNTGKDAFHGTHVAGIALALQDNGLGVSGVAPNCRFMPVQVGDENGVMSTTSIIDGLLYAMGHGAKVINMSLGMKVPAGVSEFPPSKQRLIINTLFKGEEKFWNDLFQIAYKKNIIIVLAAGNQNVMIGLDPMERSRYTIKVTATGPDERKADFSNFGEGPTLSAPGVEIYSSVPGNKFRFLDGTSMSAPIVTGGVALIKSANPALTFDQIVDLLQSTGIPVNSPGRSVGNIIQLDRAVDIAGKNRQKMPKAGCPDAQQRIDSLLQEIEKIRRSCADSGTTRDTLRIPPHSRDLNFAVGRWKSTTYLYNIRSKDQVTIYFDFFNDGTGKITLVEPDNTQCSAGLTLSLKTEGLFISQNGEAICSPPPDYFHPYNFACRSDSTGTAECEAQNKEDPKNNFIFKLVQIRQ